MKPRRFFDSLRSTRFLTQPSNSTIEPNPFFPKKSVASMVRGNNSSPRLDQIARSQRGPGTAFDELSRNMFPLGSSRSSELDNSFIYNNEEDNLYLDTPDRSYQKQKYSDESDADKVEMDAEWSFMDQLVGDDRLSNFNDPEFNDIDEYADDSEENFDMDQEDDLEDDLSFEKEGVDEENVDEEELIDDGTPDGDEEKKKTPSKYEGLVRAVKGAYLVSKKKQEDETYTEVWMYMVGNKFHNEANIRRSILSATDIDPAEHMSEDESQHAHIVTIGNVQYMTLTGITE
jgi:hypothetical protein